jgi:hypothetical protein
MLVNINVTDVSAGLKLEVADFFKALVPICEITQIRIRENRIVSSEVKVLCHYTCTVFYRYEIVNSYPGKIQYEEV